MNNLIEVDGTNYSNIGVEVKDEPVFFLDKQENGGTVIMATMSYMRDQGHYVKIGDMEWGDLADVFYMRSPHSLGLVPVWINIQTTNTDMVYFHAVSTKTGNRLFTWQQ